MSGAVAFLILLLGFPACYATDYLVGGNTGWDTSGDYTTWASDKTFNVGDNLLFVYGGSHTVDEVNKGDYDSCTAVNAISSSNDGNTTIALAKTGPHYFICSAANHCSQGMKLSITVSAATSPTPVGSPPSTTPSPPSSTTPSPPSSTTPSPPSSTTPSPPSSTTPPPSSSTPETPDTTPSTPAPTSSKTTPASSTPSNNGAMGSFKWMDALVLGASLVFAPLLVLMG